MFFRKNKRKRQGSVLRYANSDTNKRKKIRQTEKKLDELVLLGGAHEQQLTDRIINSLDSNSRKRVINMVCKADLNQTAALLQECHAVITTDSGPMHIADAVNIPIIALFTSKNYLPIWKPTGDRVIVLNHPVDCGLCFLATCNNSNKCMELITAEEVINALSEFNY